MFQLMDLNNRDTMNTKKIVIYARVSSTNGSQDYQRQIADLTTLASSNNYAVEAIFAEKCSGAKKNQERIELLKMIDFVKNNNIGKVYVSEISRLGRDPLEVLKTIEILNENKISLFIQNYSIETLTASKEINPMSQFLITILSEVARMERRTIRERISSGYSNYRANGGTVGRKQGYKKPLDEMKEQYKEEIKMLEKGYSYTHISKITNTNKNTLTKLKKLFIGG